jgi:hypothetical protein
MGLGPFVTYVPPGVYTRTLTEANVSSLVAGIRIPVFIGVGQEELEQLDLEMVRGSSSTLDQQIVREDVSMSFVVDDTNPNNPILGPTDGTKTKVRIRNFPIVDGQGFGKVTNDARSVTITVNGEPVAVGAVQGAPGYVILQVPPQIGDDVRVTYFFHRGDTSFTDDVSAQVTTDAAALTSPGYEPFSIVTGNSDTFILKVDGYERTMTFAPANYTAVSLKSVMLFKSSGLRLASLPITWAWSISSSIRQCRLKWARGTLTDLLVSQLELRLLVTTASRFSRFLLSMVPVVVSQRQTPRRLWSRLAAFRLSRQQ